MGRKALYEFWERSGGTPAGLEGVGKTSRMSWKGREDFPQVREGSGRLSAGPRGVWKTSCRSERISHRSGRGREELLQAQERLG